MRVGYKQILQVVSPHIAITCNVHIMHVRHKPVPLHVINISWDAKLVLLEELKAFFYGCGFYVVRCILKTV